MDGSASYYIHRDGFGGSHPSPHPVGFHTPPPEFQSFSNPIAPVQPNIPVSSVGSLFPGGIDIGVGPTVPSSVSVKKKRGRPRKYAPDGSVTLGLSTKKSDGFNNNSHDLNSLTPKRNRGRPPGTGRKQRLALLGDWMNNSEGQAFAPHVMRIGTGEDIVSKVLSFSQQRPRAVCILSGSGPVSSVTLHQPASTAISIRYEGRFQILCLSGSYLVSEEGSPQDRTGGLSVSLSSPDGPVIGGGAAILIASGPVQVVVCSFLYGRGGSKSYKKPAVVDPKADDDSFETEGNDRLAATPNGAPPTQSYNPSATSIWPISRPMEMRNHHMGFDLMHG